MLDSAVNNTFSFIDDDGDGDNNNLSHNDAEALKFDDKRDPLVIPLVIEEFGDKKNQRSNE